MSCELAYAAHGCFEVLLPLSGVRLTEMPVQELAKTKASGVRNGKSQNQEVVFVYDSQIKKART